MHAADAGTKIEVFELRKAASCEAAFLVISQARRLGLTISVVGSSHVLDMKFDALR